MNTTNIVGYTASFSSICVSLPQTYKILKTKSAKDLSYLSLTLNILSNSIWCGYGLLLMNFPLIIADTTIVVFLLIQLITKIYYDKKQREIIL